MSASNPTQAPEIGQFAPNFALKTNKDQVVNLNSIKGRLILIDFWASWCTPCRAANPELKELYKKYGYQGFEIVSISIDENKNSWINALDQDKLTWPSTVLDEKATVETLYGVEYLPYTYLLDETHKVVDKDFDPLNLVEILKWFFEDQVYYYFKKTNDKVYFSSKTKFVIADKKGKTLIKGKDEVADISHLPAGNYTVQYDGKVEPLIKKSIIPSSISFSPQRVDKYIHLSEIAYYVIKSPNGISLMKGKGKEINLSKFKTGDYHLFINGELHKFLKK